MGGGYRLGNEEEATYLGNTMNKKASILEEVDKQIQQVNITWWRLHHYMKASDARNKWQLLISDSVIKSKLLYGMETVQLTDAILNKIDAFQIKGFRKILGKNTPTGTGAQPTTTSWKQLAES